VYLQFWLMLPLYGEERPGRPPDSRKVDASLTQCPDRYANQELKAWAEAVLKITEHNHFSSYAGNVFGSVSIDSSSVVSALPF